MWFLLFPGIQMSDLKDFILLTIKFADGRFSIFMRWLLQSTDYKDNINNRLVQVTGPQVKDERNEGKSIKDVRYEFDLRGRRGNNIFFTNKVALNQVKVSRSRTLNGPWYQPYKAQQSIDTGKDKKYSSVFDAPTG